MADVEAVFDGAALEGAERAEVRAAPREAHEEDVALRARAAEGAEVAARPAALAAAFARGVEAADLDARALAAAAWRRGAKVKLVSGPVNLPNPTGVERISVETALEMQQRVVPITHPRVAATLDEHVAMVVRSIVDPLERGRLVEQSRNALTNVERAAARVDLDGLYGASPVRVAA